jgi:hypothetical protein
VLVTPALPPVSLAPGAPPLLVVTAAPAAPVPAAPALFPASAPPEAPASGRDGAQVRVAAQSSENPEHAVNATQRVPRAATWMRRALRPATNFRS